MVWARDALQLRALTHSVIPSRVILKLKAREEGRWSLDSRCGSLRLSSLSTVTTPVRHSTGMTWTR
eukprot:603017-Rhodomonas_salina.1